MSNRGAIKKTFESKTVLTSCSQGKSKSYKSRGNVDRPLKFEIEKDKDRCCIDQNAGGDSKITRTRNTVNKSSIRSLTPRKTNILSQEKSTLRNTPSSTLKPHSSSLLYTSSASNKTRSKQKSQTVGEMTKTPSPVEKSKFKEKIKTSSLEKRGPSSIFEPKSNVSKLKSLSTKQSTETKSFETKKRADKNNAVKESEREELRISRERRRSRTLSPSEIRVLHSAIGIKTKVEDNSKVIRGPDKLESDEDYEYEDDFESYESDFEKCTDSEASAISDEADESQNSPDLEPIEMKALEKLQKRVVCNYEVRKTEEERMLDSGHYELAEARKRAARIESMSVDSITNVQRKTPTLSESIRPVHQSYREEKQSENKSLPLSMDEGFEDGRSGDFAKFPPFSQISEFPKTAQRNSEKREPNEVLSRGWELMNMIKLDTVEWSLYESAPIAYEEFIINYGKLNSQQMSTQTNEDNLDIEIQTDEIKTCNKWTQFPITCRKHLTTNEDIKMFKNEQIGVGCDNDSSNIPLIPTYDTLQLNDFLEKTAKVMLCLLEERRFGGNILQNETHGMPLSAGCIKLSVGALTFLSGRPVTFIVYSEVLNKILLTVHAPGDEEIETPNKQDYITDCCIGCVWNISEPSRPTKVIYSQSPITSCCFHPTSYSVVFAGSQDGTINLWDLKEDEMWHQKITDKDNKTDWVIRSPTYTIAGNMEVDGHNSEVVALCILSKVEREILDTVSNKFIPIQICSLDKEGILIIWIVLRTFTKNAKDLGLSYWGDFKLLKSQKVPLFFKKSETEIYLHEFTDMNVDSIDSSDLYISANDTEILHANIIGGKTNPLFYKGDWCGNTTCIEKCPFKEAFFLVGCDDGTVRLHSQNVEKSLLQLKNNYCMSAVKTIQWSKSKPFTFFVLDDHSQIHVWDLSKSDILPTYTISTRHWGFVNTLRLSPCNSSQDMINQYLAVGTESGNVEVHKLTNNFYYSRQQDLLEEMDTFLRYVAVL